ncbi:MULTISPECIES: cytochrome P450 [Nostocales]|uniref:cytochrome P450 n=1 Tax=Nostocales TaxID=1161 RepID=UPI0016829D1F|nr:MULTISPECIES: cytochrome P450 [Nostocales]MBD2297492.1 cytochrome P450 [Nostoc sp. FACHB-190]MBD2486269.1 cytochrome P450 [Aulosira sp. FACHB-615]
MQLPNQLKTASLIQKLHWVADPVGYMKQANKQYPDIFTGSIVGFGDTVVFVSHPQGIQEILSNDRKQFTAPGSFNRIGEPIVGSSCIAMLDGSLHKKRRQLLMPAFHGERMRAYGQIISNLTEQVFAHLPVEQPFSACVAMQEISLQVTLQTIFGLYEGERYQTIKHLLASLLDVFGSPLNASLLMFPLLQKDLGAWSTWGRFLKLRQQIDELLYAEINERCQRFDPNRIDVLSLLMSAKDEEGKAMTNQELRDELILMMFGAKETLAMSMAWVLYWIHYKPEILKKLLEELDNLGESPDPMNIYRLPYLTAVCNESLRIHPAVILTLPRVVQEPVTVLGYPLDIGTVVAGCIYLTHHHKDLYPEPDQFKPERFLDRQFSIYEFLPFGGGSRRCIGEALALFEMKLVVAKVLSNYQLALVSRKPERVHRRSFGIGPTNGIQMLIRRPRNSHRSLASAATTSAS